MKDKVLIVINDNEYFNIVGGSAKDMRAVVLNAVGVDIKVGSYGAMCIPSDYNEALKAALTENNLKVEKVAVEQTQMAKTNKPKKAEIQKQDNQPIAQIPDVSELIEVWKIKPDAMIHGMTGQVFVQEVVSALLYYNNKYPKLNYQPSDAANLVIRSKQANIATHLYHIWRGNDGVINEQLDYKVYQRWIALNYPNAFVVTFEVTGKQKEGMIINKYTNGVEDRVFMACLIHGDDRREFNTDANKIYRRYCEFQKPTSLDEDEELRERARNRAAKDWAIRVGTAILEASEIYQFEWETKKKKVGNNWKEYKVPKRNENNEIIVRVENGEPVMKYSPNVGSRPLDWVGKKRAESVDLASKIGDINFNNFSGGQYEFGEGKTKFLVDNPVYDKVPDDNINKEFALKDGGYNRSDKYRQKLEKMTDEEKKARFSENVNLLRGEEEDGID